MEDGEMPMLSIKKLKRNKATMLFFKIHYGFVSPLKALLDTSMIQHLCNFSMSTNDFLELIPKHELVFTTTSCIRYEVEKVIKESNVGHAPSVINILSTLVDARCGHSEPVPGSTCLDAVLGKQNRNRFVLATTDQDVWRKYQEEPAVPIICATGCKVFLKQQSDFQKKFAEERKRKRYPLLEERLKKFNEEPPSWALEEMKSISKRESVDLDSVKKTFAYKYQHAADEEYELAVEGEEEEICVKDEDELKIEETIVKKKKKNRKRGRRSRKKNNTIIKESDKKEDELKVEETILKKKKNRKRGKSSKKNKDESAKAGVSDYDYKLAPEDKQEKRNAEEWTGLLQKAVTSDDEYAVAPVDKQKGKRGYSMAEEGSVVMEVAGKKSKY